MRHMIPSERSCICVQIQSNPHLLSTFEAPEGPAADPSIQNGSSRLLMSLHFLPRSVPNRHPQGALRTKRFFRTSVPTAMLAFADDAALARLVIAAGATPCTSTASKLSDRAVEGMPVRPRTVSGRLISLGHRPSTAGTTPCPSPAAIATAPTPIAAARSSCEQRAHGAAIAHGRQLRRAYDEIIEKDQIHSIRDSDDDFERIDLHAESENPLFFYKRAHTLWRLLDAKRAFQESECCSAKYGNALDQLLKHPRGERALSIALQEIRKAGLSSQVADLSVCGAVAPYNVLLGGKLVALLMASAETLSLYRDRYSGKPSIISSKMVTSC
jgi:hypothetical protein